MKTAFCNQVFIAMISCGIISCAKELRTFENTTSGTEFLAFEKESHLGTSANIVPEKQIGDGYKTMANLFTTGTLFSNPSIKLIPTGGSYSISFQDDLSESDLKNQLGVNISGTIPVKEVLISPEIDYARKAAKTNLSRTTTLVASLKLGSVKMQANADQTYTLASGVTHFFDSNGVLKPENIGDFYKLFGDSALVSQQLVGKIFITAKLSFDSASVSNSFKTQVGGSVASLFSGGGDGKTIAVNAKINVLDESTKKHTSLSLIAMQLGGKPGNLLSLFRVPVTCSLDQLGPCLSIVDKLNTYIVTDFKAQLNPSRFKNWYVESMIVAPYDSLNIVSPSGQPLKISLTQDPAVSMTLRNLSTRINQMIVREMDLHEIASAMSESNDLAINEWEQVENVLVESEKNYSSLRNFADSCYMNLSVCLVNPEQQIKTLMTQYPTNLLNRNLGKLLARVQSENAPSLGQDERSSIDFMVPRSVFDVGEYTSFYFKIKTVDNVLLSNKTARFDIKCNRPWINYFGIDYVLLSSVYSGFSVLNNSLAQGYASVCHNDEAIYVANPQGIFEPTFIVEMWGRG